MAVTLSSSESLEAILCTLRFSGVLYLVITLSFRLCFLAPFDLFRNHQSAGATIFFDYGCDAFFFALFLREVKYSRRPKIIDISKKHNNIDPTSGPKMNRHWGNIVMEIITVIPWELFGYASGVKQYYSLRLIKLLRLLSYFDYWDALCNSLSFPLFNFLKNPIMSRFFMLTITMAAVGHVTACLFYYFSLQQLKSGNVESWVLYDGLVNEQGIVQVSINVCYLRALYWSIQTLDTVGFGDIVAKSEGETWFCILYFYVSAYLIYYSIANLMTIITDLDASRTRSIVLKAKFTKYAAYRKLPTHLTQRVFSYYEYQWRQLKGLSEPQVNSVNTCNILNKISCTFYS